MPFVKRILVEMVKKEKKSIFFVHNYPYQKLIFSANCKAFLIEISQKKRYDKT